MRTIPLTRRPNQSFTLTLENVRWGLSLKETESTLCLDVSRNGVFLLRGSRVLAGEVLIPYEYLQSGNFIFIVNEDALPDWREFEVSQFLVFLSPREVLEFPRMTAGEISKSLQRVDNLTTDDGFYLTTDEGRFLTND